MRSSPPLILARGFAFCFYTIQNKSKPLNQLSEYYIFTFKESDIVRHRTCFRYLYLSFKKSSFVLDPPIQRAVDVVFLTDITEVICNCQVSVTFVLE